MKTLTYNLIRPRRPRYTLHSSRFTFLARPRRTRKIPFMPNKPNFQKSRLSVTLDMIRTYNANQPKKRKKNKPKTHQKREKNEPKSKKNQPKRAKFHPKNNPTKTKYSAIGD